MSSSNEQIVFADSFAGELGEGWSWLRENPDCWRIKDGGVEIRVEPGVAETVRNALVRQAPDRSQGTFAIEVSITNHALPTQQYEQAGITWYNDGTPVFKEVKELIRWRTLYHPRPAADVDQQRPTASAGYRGYLGGPVSSARRQRVPHRRVRRTPPPANDQVSIQCYNGPADEEHWIRFENFCIKRLS